MDIMTPYEAKQLGFVKYNTGYICHRGHNGWHYSKGGGCLLCIGTYPKKDARPPVGDEKATFILHPDDMKIIREMAEILIMTRAKAEFEAIVIKNKGENK